MKDVTKTTNHTIHTITELYLRHHYLKNGTEAQQKVWEVWEFLRITEHLHAYSPTLAGTYPLGIEVPGSDLDILCEVYDLNKFERLIQSVFGQYQEFKQWRSVKQGFESVVCTFVTLEFVWEIFGQPRPITEQQAFRHLVVERLLLEHCTENARAAIRDLKLAGIKTEPAFAHYFLLEGDPYQHLANLYEAPLEKILTITLR